MMMMMSIFATVGSALLMGLFGGAHCAVMCGGVSSILCTPRLSPNASKKSKNSFTFLFNAGRIAGYTALGAVVASASQLPLPPAVFDTVRFGFRVVAALCMLTVGLHLVGLPSFTKKIESIGGPLWQRLAPIAKRLIPLRRRSHALLAGGLWAFMPCGLLYAALALSASATSITEGALTMLAFGLGTLPVMAGLGLVYGRLLAAKGAVLRRAAGGIVLAFGLWSTIGVAQEATAPKRNHACCAHRAEAAR
jgi:sulfite exporter TauE/SafE